MSKYEPLGTYLRESGEPEILMTFAEIVKIIGAKLPASAFKQPAWWSNNPSNNVATYEWLGAGYVSAKVDMKGRKLVFRKSAKTDPPPVMDDTELDELLPESGDLGLEYDRSGAAEAQDGFDFSRVFGALKGTVTIKPGTDLTEPVGADWEAER